MGSTEPHLAYWQMNLPQSERPVQCPEFLANVSKKDVEILSTSASAYKDLTWPRLQTVIRENRLDLLQRRPLDLRRYLEFNHQSKLTHGSVIGFILKERVRWEKPIVPKGKPFEVQSDVCVRYNDWGYGIDRKVVHLVVWTKFDLQEDPKSGDLTNEARAEIDGWVHKTFSTRMKNDNIIWFKNWKALKSVSVLEHFHVMLYDPDPMFVLKITGGDVPMSTTEY